MGPAIGLSTSSVYPGNASTAFELARRLGYDGVEVMVWTDPVTQDASLLVGLSEHYGLPILSVHAPTLLMTQRVWGSAPWEKVDRSLDLCWGIGADTVVVHPPFRWQREYADDFRDGVALREHDSGLRIAVENMYPWRARGRELQAYLPDWDPVSMDYDHVTLDLSHTATAGSDAMEMAEALGPRLAHVHLADGSGSPRDEHLVPGRGGQPCDQLLQRLAADGFAGHVIVEVSTRRRTESERESDLAEALAFAQLHLG